MYVVQVLVLVLLGFDGSLVAKYISMNNQPCMTKPTLIDMNFDELYYCPFIVSRNRNDGNCNIAEDPFCRIYAPNKIGAVNLKAFIMTHVSLEWKMLTWTKKKWSTMIIKESFIQVMLNSTPKTMTKKQKCREKKEKKTEKSA